MDQPSDPTPSPPPNTPGWGPPPSAPPPGWGQPVPQGPPPNWPKTEPKAIWALVLSLAAYVICPVVSAVVAIILGLSARRTIARSNGTRTGSGMALAAVILGVVHLVLVMLAVLSLVVFRSDLNDWFNELTDRRPVAELTTGDCFNDATIGNSTQVTDVFVVECTTSHEGEVFLTGELPDEPSTPFPGSGPLGQQVAAQCSAGFEDYVASPYDDSIYGFTALSPSQDAWRDGARWFVCALVPKELTSSAGSARGTGR